MIFTKKHNTDLYNTLLSLSRNIFFYKKLKLVDSFETRVYLMLIHFSIILLIFKRKSLKFDQDKYDSLFHNIENNLRELGFGDVTVNKKMKELNKILYDILLKIRINSDNNNTIKINNKLVLNYFPSIENLKKEKLTEFTQYFEHFYDFCFELPLDNMLENINNFKN